MTDKDWELKTRYFPSFRRGMVKRLKKGSEIYGKMSWQTKYSMIEFMEEELIDLANYAYLAWIKLQLWKKKGIKL